jgi:ABC-type sugar transport system ATPase subunit
MLELRDVAITYPATGAGLSSTTFTLQAGDALALVGPTGSGKSTLLRLIIGLETPLTGNILLSGKSIVDTPPHQRGIAYLAQRPSLYPQLNVLENLEATVKGPLDEAISLLKIQHLLKRQPHELSGGERQRVALARCAAQNRTLWLLDEPFAPLDPVFRVEFRRELALLLTRLAATIILVSHDPLDALALGRRFGVLGDGRLLQIGTAEELRRQTPHPVSAAFLGQFFFESAPPEPGS